MGRSSHSPRGDEMAARVRAAAGYADLNRRQLGEALGYSVETISALFAGEKKPDIELRAHIAEACGVPVEFLEVGFGPLERPLTDVERRVHQLEEELRAVRAADFVAVTGDGELVVGEHKAAATPERIAELVAEFNARLRRLESRLSEGDERRQPPGALGRDARGSSPTPLHPEQDDSDQGAGSRQGSGEG